MRRILLLFDSPSVRKEAVQYSIELAKRTDSELVFLGILPGDADRKRSADNAQADSELQVRSALKRHIKEAAGTGIDVKGQVAVGDPQSELVKFLAGSSSIQTIVWGGKENVIEAAPRQKKAHWLIRAKSILECPVVVPSIKSSTVEEPTLQTPHHKNDTDEEEEK